MFFKSKTTESTTVDKKTKTREANISKAPPSLISEDMNILGNIISDGYIDVNGRVEGNIKSHTITIREKGFIKGDVVAEIVDIHGEVNGLVKARFVHLFGTAKITGVVMHESLSVDDGAFIDGQCKRTDKSQPSNTAANAHPSSTEKHTTSKAAPAPASSSNVPLSVGTPHSSQQDASTMLENIRLISDNKADNKKQV